MTSLVEWMAYALWGVIVGLGGAIAAYAFRASRATRSRSLSLLGSGFLLISAAAAFLWLGIYLGFHDPLLSGIAATASMAAGLGLVLLSVRMRAG
ncbi:MAG TPA: hypothetical protein VMG14_01480 [Thermoplasmata archaeon]|nr:hypothetical protein [Thermoplasmata archaeon]